MIVDDFDIRRTRGTARPFKAKPPLHVNADAELPLPVTMQCLKAVARQGAQIIQTRRGLQNFEPLIGLPVKPLKFPDKRT